MGVGLSMAKGGAIIPYPETIPGLLLWLRYNTGHISTDGETTLTGDIDDGDRITKWTDYSSNNNHALQDTSADCPLFESDDNTIEFSANSRWYDLASTISLTGEFTLIMRVRLTSVSLDSLFGDSGTNFFRITNNKSFRAKIGGTAQLNFTEGSDTLDHGVGAPYYMISFRRNVDSECSVVLYGGAYEAKIWGGITIEDSDTFTISNVGCQADDIQEMGGNVKDVLIYDSYLSTTELSSMHNFLHKQG